MAVLGSGSYAERSPGAWNCSSSKAGPSNLGDFEEFLRTAEDAGLGDLIQRIRSGYEEATPTGGIHWLKMESQITKSLQSTAAPHRDQG